MIERKGKMCIKRLTMYKRNVQRIERKRQREKERERERERILIEKGHDKRKESIYERKSERE